MDGCMLVGKKVELTRQEFINHTFPFSHNRGVKCLCSRCRNVIDEDKMTLTLHLCKVGFMPGYEVWMHHSESVHQTASEAEKDDRRGDDRMDEMLDAIRPEVETNPEDPPTPKIQKFFSILRASEEPLHEHTIVSVLTFVTCLMAIKSKFTFSNNCYKELLNLISDVLPNNHKMPKDMYQLKQMLSALGMEYEKIETCKDNYMVFYKEHNNETKCLKCD
jgi:hypothetical protein